MTEDERARPEASRPGADLNVTRRRTWRPDPRNVKALDRHVAHAYGPEYVRGWAA